MANAILKKGRERSLLRRHPWVFSGAIRQLQEGLRPGETVNVLSHDGQFLGRGAVSPASQIRIRIWTFAEWEAVDENFFKRRIQDAVALRRSMHLPGQTNAYRLVCAESDGLPGIIVDRYDRFLVCQFVSAGAQYWKQQVVNELKTLDTVAGIYERSDVDVREKEGLPQSAGPLWGDVPPPRVEIEEHGIKFFVDIERGHKTGFYLDQRVNRHLVQSCSSEKKVLNCFAYTGGFGLAALKGCAAHVTNVEDGAGPIEMIDQHLRLNRFDPKRCTNIKADVFRLLRQYEEEGRSFDMIILDPPKFADAQKHLARAGRGYKDINRLACKLLRSQGLLFTFSCSGLIKMELFQKIVADAAIDARRDAQVLQWLNQSPDHPVKLHVPESVYLKGLLLRICDPLVSVGKMSASR